MEENWKAADEKKVTSSSDHPASTSDYVAVASSLDPDLCHHPDANGVHTTSHQDVAEQGTHNGYIAEKSPIMSAHEYVLNEGCSEPQLDWEENDFEDQDSTNSTTWVQKQKNCGIDPRMILGEILPKGTLIPNNVNEGLLWRYIINMLNEPKRSKLTDINTLEDAVQLLRTCKKVVVLTGAGVSVSCGIPDFRSKNGVYARLSKDYPDLPDPQAMFDINYFRRDPRPFFKFAKEIYPGQFQPSPSHRFIKLLEKQGKLLRNYTQNIDTLEHAAGIQNVITCHGSFATATCTICRYKVDSSVIKEDIFNQTIPYCPVCSIELGDRGIMKPDIVFFGEGLSDEFHESLSLDKEVCDLLIVVGSSLKVRPVAMIPNSIPTSVPQILINREPLRHLTFDIELLGDCDVIIGEICQRLQSEWHIDKNIISSPLNEITIQPTKQSSLQTLSDLATLDSSDLAEINNNFDLSQSRAHGEPSSLTQSEESNSCDYHGLSAIKLDDSEDGSNPEQLFIDSSCNQRDSRQEDDDYSSWSCNSKDNFSKKPPDQSFLFVPPNRYIFRGAEVDKEEEEDDTSSTSTDYSSDSDSPQRPSHPDISFESIQSACAQSPEKACCEHSEESSNT